MPLSLPNEGVDLNSKDEYGRTLLHYAAIRGHEEVVRLFLEQQGVDLNARGNDGMSPLHLAITMGHDRVVRLLLEQEGVDLNAKNNSGCIPRDYLAVLEYYASLLDEVSQSY
ncbi:acyl-CoA binding domain-containing protein 6 [Rhizina undulata]